MPLKNRLVIACAVIVAVCVQDAMVGRALGQQLGACCHADGTCQMTDSAGCPPTANNFFQGGCITCDIALCTTACCALDGSCAIRSQNACFAAQGSPQGLGSLCEPQTACPFSLGTCCTGNGFCTTVTRIQCNGAGGLNGDWRGTGVLCNDFCPAQRGACCQGGLCTITLEADCLQPGLRWAGPVTSCHPITHVCCRADYNISGTVTLTDIFDFLNAFFARSMGVDINRNCQVSVQDIFDFLAAWFVGC